MAKFTLTPWEVKGQIDYSKVMTEFGVQALTPRLLNTLGERTGGLHHLLRRGIFFAHRDLEFALKEHEKGNLFMYTGCGPSGPIHMGHAMVWMFTKWLQDALDVDLWFQFTDDEKFLFKDQTLEQIQAHMHENMLDVIALGFDPKRTHFLVDTTHAHLMYPEAIKVAKRITFSTTKAAFGFDNETNIGSIFFTSMQAVPAFLPCVLTNKKMACLIPHAIDQDPHFRVTRDVLPKLGYFKPASIQCRFLPGLAGMDAAGKMSSSEGQAIYLTDDAATVRKKINKYAFSGGRETVEEHRKRGGNANIDIAYQWLTFFEPDDKVLERIHQEYTSGAMLSGELKVKLADTLNTFLAAHQARRAKAASRIKDFLYQG